MSISRASKRAGPLPVTAHIMLNLSIPSSHEDYDNRGAMARCV
jgi:hypothetical protein